MTAPSSIRVGALALPLLVPRLVLVGDAPTPYGAALVSPDAVWALFANDAPRWDRERFLTLALDTKKRLLGVEEVSVGTLNSTLVHPREIFKALILANAESFICVHNHPSGDPTPSVEDREVTRRLKEAGALLGIPLVDHIVLGHTTFHSLQADGDI
jgi:DNA repair protein RadC